MQRVVLTTGGTGGHIFPALAVAQELQKRFPTVKILFIGSEYGPEKDLVTQAGIAFKGLAVRGFIGRGFKALGAGTSMVRALFAARTIIKDFMPDVVIGFGGYAAFAPLLAAKLCHIPTALHEQNAVVGVSNKILGKLVDAVYLSMPLTQEENTDAFQGFAKEKTVLTGNPVRDEVAAVGQKAHAFSGKKLFVLGGSLGAKALNDLLIQHIKALQNQGITVRHQTGSKEFERVHAAYVEQGAHVQGLSAFVHDMAKAYAEADMVLCRAGASTVAELAAAGRGAIFVPYPHATHDHQSMNARVLTDFGAAKSFAEKDMQAQGIMDTVVELLHNPEELQRMGKAAKEQSRPHAAQDIVNNLQKLVLG